MDENKNDVDSKEVDDSYNFQKTYGWFVILNKIAGNDFTKHTYIYEKKIMEVLNQISFLLDYDREQIKLQKRQSKTI
jgi:hypothetical protein